jgi:hypothetical protein
MHNKAEKTRSIALPLILSIAMVGGGGAALPPSATASHSQQTIFDATKALLATPPAAQAPVLNTLRRDGVDTIRMLLPWRYLVPFSGQAHRPAGFNPADPKDYPPSQLATTDAVVRGARARGMRVLLTLSSPTPDWASGSGHSAYALPLPSELRKFALALGRRYNGRFRPTPTAKPLPRVSLWSVYNEPNLDTFLRPQRRHGRPNFAAGLYRRLFLAAQKGLRASGHGGDTLLIGETSPSNGGNSTSPPDFLRGVLCLDRNYHRRRACRPIDASGWAHHPYSFVRPPYVPPDSREGINLATIGRLTGALRRAHRAGATRRWLPVYITEFGIVSVPNSIGVSLAAQVNQMAISEYVAWRNPKIRSFANYLFNDDPSSFDFPFTTGLFTETGGPKPLSRSFPITMLVKRSTRGRVMIWGHVRPASSPVRVTVRYRSPGGGSHVLRRFLTNRRGYFIFFSKYRRGRRWQASSTLPGGSALAGPYVTAVSFRA